MFASSNLHNSFRPKLWIKLQENDYLMWNQLVEEVIITQKMHKLVINPQIFQKFQNNLRSSHMYSLWWIRILDCPRIRCVYLVTFHHFWVCLPRVLSCKQAFEIWDKVHKYFNAQMKAKVRQLRVQLKSTRKNWEK